MESSQTSLSQEEILTQAAGRTETETVRLPASPEHWHGVYGTNGPPQTPELRKYESGAVRSNDVTARFDLICPTALKHLALVCEEGVQKYGLNNWTKGLDISETLNHALNHINLWTSRDRTELHLAKAMWNLMAVIHYMELCRCAVERHKLTETLDSYITVQKV